MAKNFGMCVPGSSFLDETERTDTPVGARCARCDEEIVDGDAGIIEESGLVFHYNCFLRPFIGSVAHIERRCSCFMKGSVEDDPEGMTRRQAADAAVAAWLARGW